MKHVKDDRQMAKNQDLQAGQIIDIFKNDLREAE